jgi:hypothetical protein
MMSAVESESIAIVRWLLEKGCPQDINALHCAAYNGQFNIMELLYKNGYPLLNIADVKYPENVCTNAADIGDLEGLKALRKMGFQYNKCNIPSVTCNYKMMEWMIEDNCPWNFTHAAIANGQFSLLKWLHEKGRPMDDAGCTYFACRYGELEILHWLHEKGCPYQEDIDVILLEEDIWECLSGCTVKASLCQRKKMQCEKVQKTINTLIF